jgi:ribosomal protein L12E/L44/L45/RPP1/RPP2
MSLEKIASKQSLTKEDIVSAANELIELEKQAADADAYGRELAHKYVEELVKQANEESVAAEAKKEGETVAEEKKEEEKKEEAEKTSSDKELLSAIATLRQLGIVK